MTIPSATHRPAIGKLRAFGLVNILVVLTACSTISSYDQAAYSQAVSVKVDALALMDKATTPYASHAADIQAVTVEMDKAYEYEKGRALNQITVSQWDILRNPIGDAFGGFLKTWQTKGTLKSYFIEQKKTQISKDFDQIIQLEAGKSR